MIRKINSLLKRITYIYYSSVMRKVSERKGEKREKK